MQAFGEVTQSMQRTLYRVANQSIVVETQDAWAAEVIERLFAGWYLTSQGPVTGKSSSSELVIKSSGLPPQIPVGWAQFEIAGGGTCHTDGDTSYIDIEGSIVRIGNPAHAVVEVSTSGPLEIPSSVLTRVVTYALAAVLRRRRLFELHSGAVIHPRSGGGVLIIGPSGSGKSTLTVQLATAGWPFLTDDVLLLSKDIEVQAWPLRRCFAVTAETFAVSDFLQRRVSLDYQQIQENDKRQFGPHGVFASGFRENCAPRTLFFSEVVGGDSSEVQRLSPAETMARLIRMNPWSCYDRSTAAGHLELLSSLVKQAAGYYLRAGKDLLDPEVSATLIETCVHSGLMSV